MPVTGTNVHPGYLEAARDLMKDHLMGTGRFNVVCARDDGQPGLEEEDVVEAVSEQTVPAELTPVR